MTGTRPQTRRLGYARVSTVGQTLDSQLDGDEWPSIGAAGCAASVPYRHHATNRSDAGAIAPGCLKWLLWSALGQPGEGGHNEKAKRPTAESEHAERDMLPRM
jgi:hypothetical protein